MRVVKCVSQALMSPGKVCLTWDMRTDTAYRHVGPASLYSAFTGGGRESQRSWKRLAFILSRMMLPPLLVSPSMVLVSSVIFATSAIAAAGLFMEGALDEGAGVAFCKAAAGLFFTSVAPLADGFFIACVGI